ncbi:hypothetical protein B0H67DRAFT_27748 [Lasiosphaeris hirsuta]|uniref:Uncharacterized protein n=1 Tax=Lasiosphaeris hirsuta TaxID=260670 RepID=A0AA40B9U1_9PEZI|nr:hypothetical protein B0H67DRAFT_27748 [Lasiosphaeris hirsuta]
MSLCENLQGLKKDATEAAGERQELELRNWDLLEDFGNIQQAHAGLRRQNSALQDESRKCMCSLTTPRHEYVELEKENARLKQHNEDLEQQVSDLEEAVR